MIQLYTSSEGFYKRFKFTFVSNNILYRIAVQKIISANQTTVKTWGKLLIKIEFDLNYLFDKVDIVSCLFEKEDKEET